MSEFHSTLASLSMDLLQLTRSLELWKSLDRLVEYDRVILPMCTSSTTSLNFYDSYMIRYDYPYLKPINFPIFEWRIHLCGLVSSCAHSWKKDNVIAAMPAIRKNDTHDGKSDIINRASESYHPLDFPVIKLFRRSIKERIQESVVWSVVDDASTSNEVFVTRVQRW